MKACIVTPFYDWDGRKYFELKLENGEVRRVKIPWRYGRVACKVEGLKTCQELSQGDIVDVEIILKNWNGIEHWIVNYIKYVDS